MMGAKYILAALAGLFLIAAAVRGRRSPQTRIWILIAAIFGTVSFWLFAAG
jgi:DMSO reductase anchor subunit